MEGFDWDKGNIDKNWKKHKVSNKECEEVFFSEPLVTFEDVKHSTSEKRFVVIGSTENGRVLQVVYTRRGNKIRVVSARGANKKERKYYESTKSK